MPRRTAVVVEDERLPREELCAMLGAEGIEVVGQAATVDEAVRIIGAKRPDLVFLDIQLGRESAFDVLEHSDEPFDVIFVTAYDQHAVRAFEVNALDYLLKPVNPERLREALGRLESEEAITGPDALESLAPDDRLFLKVGSKWRFLRIDTIRVIEASGDFTRVRLLDGADLLIGKSLREWEARLPDRLFVRIHRSTIVNLDQVRRIDEWFNRTFQVHMEGIPEPYAMSRRYAARLKH
ncbi:MAG: LytTR family DNA-binding domain-containing protein [Gemmatimonadota bacterium]